MAIECSNQSVITFDHPTTDGATNFVLFCWTRMTDWAGAWQAVVVWDSYPAQKGWGLAHHDSNEAYAFQMRGSGTTLISHPRTGAVDLWVPVLVWVPDTSGGTAYVWTPFSESTGSTQDAWDQSEAALDFGIGFGDGTAKLSTAEVAIWTDVAGAPTESQKNRLFSGIKPDDLGLSGLSFYARLRSTSDLTAQVGGMTGTLVGSGWSNATDHPPVVETIVLPSAGDVRDGVDRGDGVEGTLILPAEADVEDGVLYGAGGTEYEGELVVSCTYAAAGDVRSGVDRGDGVTGTLTLPAAAQVLNGVQFGAAGTEYTGTVVQPAAGNVRSGTAYGPSSGTTGTCHVPAAADVRSGTNVDATTGSLAVPAAGNVRHGTAVDNTTGTCRVPGAADVRSGTLVDATSGSLAVPAAADVRHGTAVDATTGTCRVPSAANVRDGVLVDAGSGTLVVPAAGNVRDGVVYDATTEGTLAVPAAADVRYGTPVDAGTGSLVVPAAGDVRDGVVYDATTEGTLVLPAEADVEDGVGYGAGGNEFEGSLVAGGGGGGGFTFGGPAAFGGGYE
jgi:hypothetical protein